MHNEQRTDEAMAVGGKHTSDQTRGWMAVHARATYLIALFGACSVPLFANEQCRGQCEYQATIVQAAECPIFGTPGISAGGLNAGGHLAGWHATCDFVDDIAYVWTPQSGMTDIPFPAGTTRRVARDINGTGCTVGYADLPEDGLGDIAFVFENGQVTSIGTLPGGNYSGALAINESGNFVGTWGNNVAGPAQASFLWQDGVMTDLELPIGPNSEANDISDAGQIVGWMGVGPHISSHAYIWNDGDVTDLGMPPGAFASEAVAVDNSGRVLVQARFEGDKGSAFLVYTFIWSDGQWTNLGVVAGFDRCFGLDFNEVGQVVGYCSGSPGLTGFFWQHGVMITAGDLSLANPDEINLGTVCVINEGGQIAADGGFDSSPAVILLTPVNQPIGDVDHDCVVGIHDFLTVLGNWGPCSDPCVACVGDTDGDYSVGILDFLSVIGNWTF